MVAPTSSQRRRKLTLTLAAAAALAVAISAWLVLSRKTLEGVAAASFDAIINGDGGALLDNMSDEERAAYGMDATQWSNFLDNYVAPAMRGWNLVKEKNTEFRPESDTLTNVHAFFTPDGRTATLRISAARTEAGPRSVELAKNILLFVGVMKYAPRQERNERSAIFRSFYQLAALDGTTLSGFGLNGAYNVTSRRMQPWPEIEEQFARFVKMMDDRAAAKKTP